MHRARGGVLVRKSGGVNLIRVCNRRLWWRVRAAEGTRLESECCVKATEGSNPSATAKNFFTACCVRDGIPGRRAVLRVQRGSGVHSGVRLGRFGSWRGAQWVWPSGNGRGWGLVEWEWAGMGPGWARPDRGGCPKFHVLEYNYSVCAGQSLAIFCCGSAAFNNSKIWDNASLKMCRCGA